MEIYKDHQTDTMKAITECGCITVNRAEFEKASDKFYGFGWKRPPSISGLLLLERYGIGFFDEKIMETLVNEKVKNLKQ